MFIKNNINEKFKNNGKGGKSRNNPIFNFCKEEDEKILKNLECLKYWDHIQFLNCPPTVARIRECMVRKVIGWVYEENHQYIILVSDIPEKNQILGKKDITSGFIILKSCIIERRPFITENLRSSRYPDYVLPEEE